MEASLTDALNQVMIRTCLTPRLSSNQGFVRGNISVVEKPGAENFRILMNLNSLPILPSFLLMSFTIIISPLIQGTGLINEVVLRNQSSKIEWPTQTGRQVHSFGRLKGPIGKSRVTNVNRRMRNTKNLNATISSIHIHFSGVLYQVRQLKDIPGLSTYITLIRCDTLVITN